MNNKYIKFVAILFLIVWPFLAAYADGQMFFGLFEITLRQPYTPLAYFAIKMIPGLLIINVPTNDRSLLKNLAISAVYIAVFYPASIIVGFGTGCYMNPCKHF